jgi:hypothetical protein
MVGLMNDELERMWKEAAVASFEGMARYLPWRTEKVTRNVRSVG